ncbi:MAG: molybdopterin-dependent oxidoreductase [Raoultibacter sp.]
MKHTVTKIVSAAAGVALLSPSIALATPVPEDAQLQADETTWTQVAGSLTHAAAPLEAVSNVSGSFAYQQGAITSNHAIAQVFQKATNALCSADKELTVTAASDWVLSVTGDVENAYTATLGSLAQDDEQTTLMGCSCAANLPGGNAVINAEVTGIPLATIIERAVPLSGVNTVTLVSEDGYKMSLPLDYVLARKSIVSYAINHEALNASVGGTNQVWIDSTAAKYFTRNVVAIELTAETTAPAVPGTEAAPDNQYTNRPNVGITAAS